MNRLHEEPTDAAATQRLVHDNVVNMPDKAVTGRRCDGQRRDRDKHFIMLSHDQDEPVVAEPLRQHFIGQGVNGRRQLREESAERCQQVHAPLRRQNGGRRVHGRRVASVPRPRVTPLGRGYRGTSGLR